MKIIVALILISAVCGIKKLEVDYAVAGSGSGGGVMTGLLSEDSRNDVFMAERGHDVTGERFISVPTLNDVVPFYTNLYGVTVPVYPEIEPTESWRSIEPFFFSGSLSENVPFAKKGGPGISGSFAGWPDPDNLNEWAALTCSPSLNYTNFAINYQLNENVSFSDSSAPNRGRSGPIQIAFTPFNDSSLDPFMPAHLATFGTTYGHDYSTAAGLRGTWPMQRSLARDGICTPTSGPCQRQTAYGSFVEPYLNTRPNLDVEENATVLALTFKPGTNPPRVNGFKYLTSDDQIIHVKAKKGVILAAGAFNTARILMQSGIGDPALLREIGVETVVNLTGVGKNLQDQQFTPMIFYFANAATVTLPSSVRITFTATPFNGGKVDLEVDWGLLPPSRVGQTTGAVLLVEIVQLRGTTAGGQMKLRSKVKTEKPEFYIGTDPLKLGPLIYGMQLVRTWIDTVNSTQPVGPYSEVIPGYAKLPKDATNEQYLAFVGSESSLFYHPGGTAAPGCPGDPMAVTDDKGKVLGLDGLWVADNSFEKTIVATHPSLTASAIARHVYRKNFA